MQDRNMEIVKHVETEIPFCEKCGWVNDGQSRTQTEEQAHFEICPDCKAQTIWIKKD